MKRVAAALLIALALASPAAAHKLKVFATVEGQAVRGYAFFIGGGRPNGSPWIAKDAAGKVVASGTTDAEGRFAFALPAAATTDLTVTVDTQEAHVASATLAASRLAGASSTAPPAPAPADGAADAGGDEARLAALIGAAVQKEIEPLMERLEAMDARLRFTDMLSGVFLIIGLAGIGLWARGLRR
ncbi:cobalamin biosynthesis protein CbiL [Antarcticirhabdus aurantiaca]|uniref:Cobalamin biosynthesis protein CbiL n=1 Tax=Antarcticirhabdus aurantiaca TaxID=2606717 RepID=A0ACD4NHB8_9HYPH|nr:cobalamin biosynthesis protein CbiL [Antarcticirhabdus aurantiaca]WAJ26205.1 cobalamin biosynthesis protein CbiL [Jeongeuplla avenae]